MTNRSIPTSVWCLVRTSLSGLVSEWGNLHIPRRNISTRVKPQREDGIEYGVGIIYTSTAFRYIDSQINRGIYLWDAAIAVKLFSHQIPDPSYHHQLLLNLACLHCTEPRRLCFVSYLPEAMLHSPPPFQTHSTPWNRPGKAEFPRYIHLVRKFRAQDGTRHPWYRNEHVVFNKFAVGRGFVYLLAEGNTKMLSFLGDRCRSMKDLRMWSVERHRPMQGDMAVILIASQSKCWMYWEVSLLYFVQSSLFKAKRENGFLAV